METPAADVCDKNLTSIVFAVASTPVTIPLKNPSNLVVVPAPAKTVSAGTF